MTRRQIETFHLLQMAKSLEAQNEAIRSLIMQVTTINSMASRVGIDQLRGMVADLNDEAQKVRAAVWPQKEEDNG